MAKINKGILGAVSGKIGPVIGATWKTIAYIKAVSPKKPGKRTKAQIATQEKMRFINNFLVPFHPYITVGMKNEAKSQTEISAAFSTNYHRTVLGTFPDLSVDYAQFIFSKGSLPMVSDMMITSNNYTLQFTWNSQNGQKARFDDQMIIVLYVATLHKTQGFIGGVNRSANKCSLELTDNFRGKEIDIYASITSLDRKKIADNTYLGRFVF
jgi:hypothetical protein